MRKLLVFLLVTLFSVSAYGGETITRTDITSWDGLTVNGYNTDLNNIVTKINTGIYGSNIVNDTLSHDDFGENARLDLYEEETVGSFVYTGLTLPTSGSRTDATITAGTAYVGGMRVVKGAETKTFDASDTTYVFIDEDSNYRYDTGSSTPQTNEIYIGSVTTDADNVTAADETERQTVPPNLRVYTNYITGCWMSRDSTDTDLVHVKAGEIEFGTGVTDPYRINTVSVDVDFGTTGLGGIAAADAAIANDTFYYIYAAPDPDTTSTFKCIAGTTMDLEAGVADVTDERLIGWCYAGNATDISTDSLGAWKGSGGDAPNIVMRVGQGDATCNSTGELPVPNLKAKMVTSGNRPVRVDCNIPMIATGGAAHTIAYILLDGTTPIVSGESGDDTGFEHILNMTALTFPEAGEHTFEVYWYMDGSNSNVNTIMEEGNRYLIVQEL